MYSKFEIGGPLRGVHFHIGSSVKVRFYYNDCACDFSASPASATLLLGASESVAFSLVSVQGAGLYPAAADSCALATITQDTASNLFSLSGSTGTIETLDTGSPKTGAVGSSSLTFSWAAPNTGDSFNLVFPLEVQPACSYSAISWDPSTPPISLASTATYDLALDGYSHAYAATWAAAGYANACTIGFALSGDAAAFASVSGSTVTVAPDASTEVGLHDLVVTAVYTAVTHGTVPTNQQVARTFQVAIARGAEIETWPMYTIWGLGWANLAFAVVALHLFADKVRRRHIAFKTVVEKPHERTLEAARSAIDLVLMD